MRERLAEMREEGRAKTELFRRLANLFAELGAVLNLMEAYGEVDPKEAQGVRYSLAPSLRGLHEQAL